MSDMKDFVIEDGVLKKYVGEGGNVVIPDGVTDIGFAAFFERTNITSVEIPNSVTKISEKAFDGCSDLVYVTIPNSVITIGNYAFWNCSGLKSVRIPDSVTEINIDTFSNCSGIENIEVSEGNPIYRSVNNCLINSKTKTMLLGCKNSVIPDFVKKIGTSAFYGCSGLLNIEIPNSVTEIGKCAFCDCTSLKKVTIPNGVTKIGSSAFSRCTSLTNITIPNGITEICKWTFCECENLSNVNLPDGVLKIAEEAFCDCTSLVNLTAPQTLTELGKGAFENVPLICFVAPNIPFKVLKKEMLLFPATIGFLSQQEKFTDGDLIKEYEKFEITHRKILLSMVLERDFVLGISAYVNSGIINEKNFENEILIPAQEFKAMQCVAFLLECKNKHIAQEEINDDFENQFKNDALDTNELKKIWTCEKKKDGSLSIAGYKGASRNVVIPEQIGNKPVKAVSYMAFSPYKHSRLPQLANTLESIQSITIPDSVKIIIDSAFKGCAGLRSVIISDSVVKIGKDAFCLCPNVTIHAPAGSYAEQYAKENNIPFVAE